MRVAIVVALSIALGTVAGDAPGSAPAPVIDGAGRSVRVPVSCRRIVSLAPSVTEMLFALGAGGRVVGVTSFCDYPPEVGDRPRIGGMINPDLERIVDLKPDLAIATTAGNYLDDAERIERLGIPVYTIDIPDLAGMLSTLETMGDLLQLPVEGRRLAAGLRARIARVREAAAGLPRIRTLFVIEPDPLIAPGPRTFIGEALATAGADLVTPSGGTSWTQLDMEQAIGLAPELLLTPEANRAWAETLPRRADWRRLPAVRTGRIIVVSDAIQHPGPRLVDGIEEVAALIAGSLHEPRTGTPPATPPDPRREDLP